MPALGSIRLEKLRPSHIQAAYATWSRKDKRNDTALAVQSAVHHHRVLRCALQAAVKLQLVTRNPCDAVKAPRVPHKEVKVLTEAETAFLLEAAKGSRTHLPILLAVTTGMRRGEILGLRYSDVDLSAAKLTVRRSLSQGRRQDGVQGAKNWALQNNRSPVRSSGSLEATP